MGREGMHMILSREAKSLPALMASVAVVGFVCLAFAQSAAASHYHLDSWEEEWPPDVLDGFRELGLNTTEDVLKFGLTELGRKKISDAVGWSELDTYLFVLECEFLQIEGVGPKVVRLLRAAGVVDTKDLAARDPKELLERLIDVNRREHITGIDPAIENVENWVERAKSVPYHVQ